MLGSKYEHIDVRGNDLENLRQLIYGFGCQMPATEGPAYARFAEGRATEGPAYAQACPKGLPCLAHRLGLVLSCKQDV
uniref:Uncharacterized protein n=1 Tax=Nymphaea colorata TaxID=210225 RepID=A0A5K1EWC4_9MAGN|nr:unnamed protein product [Nymphaea colorata]